MLEGEEEEEELDVTIEEEESSELWDAWDGELSVSQGKTQSSRADPPPTSSSQV